MGVYGDYIGVLRCLCGFSQNWGTSFGGTYNKNYRVWGSYWGLASSGKLPCTAYVSPIIPVSILSFNISSI